MPSSQVSHALLAPRSVALIGASGDLAKASSRPQRYLKQHGFSGDVHLINPSRDTLFGDPAVPTLSDVKGNVDHALVMVSGQHVASAIDDCVAAGIKCATILTDGFAEKGAEGRALQRDICARASRAGLRLLGPNSIGLINTHAKVALSANAALAVDRLLPGKLGLISQSGSAIGALLSRAQDRGIGFSTLISVGNEADLGVGELAPMLVEQDETEAILLFLETIRDGAALAAAARRANARGKPVIAYLLGRSQIAQEISGTHTGAIATDFAAMRALLRESGIMVVDMLETLFELPALALGQKPAHRRRAMIVTTTGGGGAMVADRLGQAGVDVVGPDEPMSEQLAARGLDVAPGPMMDLTMAGTRPGRYAAALEVAMTDDRADLVVAVAGSSAQFRPEETTAPMIASRAAGKPLATFIAPCAPEALSLLSDNGVAAFRSPESCAEAVRAFLDWHPVRPEPDDALLSPAIRAQIDTLLSGTSLNELSALELFQAVGVPTVPCTRFDNVEELTAAAGDLCYPVVLKVLSQDLPHKTEVGGVALGLQNQTTLAAEAVAMLGRINAAAPEAHLEGFLVQPMRRGLAEALIGLRRVPSIGTVITLAAGGVTAELYQDFALRMAPVDTATALEMIDELRGLAVLRGYRNLPRGDCAALAEAVVALSRLALEPRIDNAEINPVAILPEGEGVMALDGLIITAKANDEDEEMT